MIKFIDGFVALSKVNEPNVINIDAFNVPRNHQNARKIVFNSQNHVPLSFDDTSKNMWPFLERKIQMKKMRLHDKIFFFVCVR